MTNKTIKQQLRDDGYQVFWYMKTDAVEIGVAKKGMEFFTIRYFPYRGKATIRKGVDFWPCSPTPELIKGIEKAIKWVKANR